MSASSGGRRFDKEAVQWIAPALRRDPARTQALVLRLMRMEESRRRRNYPR